MSYLDEHIAQKKAIYHRYKEGLKGLPVTMNPYDADSMSPNFWLSCILIDKEAMCQQIRSDNTTSYVKEKGKTCPDEIYEVLENCNAQARPIWKPMHMQPIHRMHTFVTREGAFSSSNSSWDVGADLFQRGLCLPSDNKMTIEEQDKIIQIIRSCFE
jgi:dTDP-4-amino-4,6-dideoxygalactose transaminase